MIFNLGSFILNFLLVYHFCSQTSFVILFIFTDRHRLVKVYWINVFLQMYIFCRLQICGGGGKGGGLAGPKSTQGCMGDMIISDS